jgi:hypothetical protein
MPGPAKKQTPWDHRARRRFREVDGRTLPARTEKWVIGALTEHVGGDPTAPQTILIGTAAKLVAVTEILGNRLIADGKVSENASHQFLAWANSLRLILTTLGIERQEQAPARLAEILQVRTPPKPAA